MTSKSVLDVSDLFDRARNSVPAYAKFLKEAGLSTQFYATTPMEWSRVPLMNKPEYIHKYPPKELFPAGKMASIGHASSGSSGKPTFWFRGPRQKKLGVQYYSRILYEGFGIPRDEPTLVVICFSLGVWVAGIYTLLAVEQIAENSKGGLSVLTPGIEINDICSILTDIAPTYQNVVIVGYPGFLDVLFDQMKKRGIPLHQSLFLITSGDKSSEEWRDLWIQDLGMAGPGSIANVYGSSDGGILAFETPLAIEIRRKLRGHPDLREAVFGHSEGMLPALFQFDPASIYFEEVNGELVLTADLDLPLIRYNIRDSGKVHSFPAMFEIARKLGIERTHRRWELPFVTVSGRTDVAVVVFAVKVFPENIQAGVRDPEIAELLSGSFWAHATRMLDAGTSLERIQLELELARRLVPSSEIELKIASVIQSQLVRTNIEYRKLASTLGAEATMPKIRLYPHGDPEFIKSTREKRESNAFLWQPGKKPAVAY